MVWPFSHHVSLPICCIHGIFEIFISVMKQGVNSELREKATLLSFKHCKEPSRLLLTPHFPRKISSISMEYFSAICYDEKQAHIVCGVHLVIFSTSFQWKSINLLVHIFRQEIDCICRTLLFCGSSVGSQQCLKLWKVHTCQFIHQLRKIYQMIMLIMDVLKIAYWVSHSKILWYLILIFIDIQCIFHYKLLSQCLRSIIELLQTPVTRVYQCLFTIISQTISMENLNGKQNLRPEKGICSYLVKFFYCVIDTVYVEYTGLFFVSLLCPCFSCAATLWNKSPARIRPLIICVDHNACQEDGNIILLCLLVTDWLVDGMTDYITD